MKPALDRMVEDEKATTVFNGDLYRSALKNCLVYDTTHCEVNLNHVKPLVIRKAPRSNTRCVQLHIAILHHLRCIVYNIQHWRMLRTRLIQRGSFKTSVEHREKRREI